MSSKVKFPGDFTRAFPNDLGKMNRDDYVLINAEDGKIKDDGKIH